MRHKVYFRADAGQSIGYGHFIRSLALADMLKESFDCSFFTQTPTQYQREEVAGVCPLVSLPSDESRFAIFLDWLQGDEIVVLDNYFYTSDYQKQIKDKGCKLVCIDDMHDKHFYADVVINHCDNSYIGYDAECETKFFLGSKWALLRPQFLQRATINKKKNHWVVTFGGSDPYNLTLKFVNYLKQVKTGAIISVMVGDGYRYFDELEKYGNVEIFSRISSFHVAGLFRSAENVVCSASSVCYEALSLGCNVYAGYYVDNQKDFYNNLVSAGLIIPLGNLLTEQFWENVNKPKQCPIISFGDVARRYKMIFHALSFDVVRYQNMTDEQSRLTWECRNDQSIRQWMTNSDPFSFDSHRTFVSGLNNSLNKIYYSFFDGGKFIGSYNFEIKDGNKAEHGLFVSPDYQGNHIATIMETFLDGEIIKFGIKRIIARILKCNIISYGYHIHNGYKLYKEDEVFYYLERSL